jgi:hypothetical protein
MRHALPDYARFLQSVFLRPIFDLIKTKRSQKAFTLKDKAKVGEGINGGRVKVQELCKTCKYVTVLSHGVRCRKKVRARYVRGELVCTKYRMSKKFQKDSLLG